MTEKLDNEHTLRDLLLREYAKSIEPSKQKSNLLEFLFARTKPEDNRELFPGVLYELRRLLQNENNRQAKALAEFEKQSPKFEIEPSAVPGRLTTLFAEYQKTAQFKVGDLVVWKDGLQNRVHPAATTPAIVMEVAETPFAVDDARSDSIYFQEKLDLKLGVLKVETGDLVSFWFDGSRFKIFEA